MRKNLTTLPMLVLAFSALSCKNLMLLEKTKTISPPETCTCIDSEAGFGGGVGSNGDPFIVCKRAHLEELQSKMVTNYNDVFDKEYLQSCNIDLSESPFTPIGNPNTNALDFTDFNTFFATLDQDANDFPFEGVFNGNNLNIKGLSIQGLNKTYQGLFNFIGPNGKIKNVNLTEVSISVTGFSHFIGGIAGKMKGLAENTTVSGNLLGEFGSSLGLAFGMTQNATISSLQVSGSIDVDGTDEDRFLETIAQGGISGFDVTSNYSNFSTNVEIKGATITGGFIGMSSGSSFSTCSSLGNVVAHENVGGFVGRVDSATITDSFSDANVEALQNHAGGFAHTVEDSTLTNNYASGNVIAADGAAGFAKDLIEVVATNTYASGNVSGFVTVGFAEVFESGSCTNCYATGNVTSTGDASGFAYQAGDGAVFNKIYSTGTVTSTDTVDGWRDVAGLFGVISQDIGDITVTNCYSTSNLIAEVGKSDVGGLVADFWNYENNAVFSNCYFAGTINGGNNVGGIVGIDNNLNGGTITFNDVYFDQTILPGISSVATGNPGRGEAASTAQLQATNFYPGGWDFGSIWQIIGTGNYPTFQ